MFMRIVFMVQNMCHTKSSRLLDIEYLGFLTALPSEFSTSICIQDDDHKDHPFYDLLLTSYVMGSRENIPTVSKLCAIGTTPATEIAPCEGRNPNMPQFAAGSRTLPAVSEPNKRNRKSQLLWYTS
jgi:hypothetical protein